MSMTRKEPVGAVGQIIPRNYPIMMLAWKWGQALPAGCTIVLKPAESTPLTALYMAALTKEVFLIFFFFMLTNHCCRLSARYMLSLIYKKSLVIQLSDCISCDIHKI